MSDSFDNIYELHKSIPGVHPDNQTIVHHFSIQGIITITEHHQEARFPYGPI